MTNIATAASRDLKNLVSMLEGVIALQKEAEKIGSLEKVMRARETEIKALEAHEAAARTRLSTLAAEASKTEAAAKVKADAILADAKKAAASAEALMQTAKQAIANATAEAGDIKALAREDAEALRAKGAEDLKAFQIKGQKITADAQAAADKVEGDTRARLKDLETLNAQVKAAESRLAGVEAKIVALRNQFA